MVSVLQIANSLQIKALARLRPTSSTPHLLRDHKRHGQRIANSKQPPNQSLGQTSTNIVHATLAPRLTLVHETLAKEHRRGLGKEVGPHNRKRRRNRSAEAKGGEERRAPGDEAPHHGLNEGSRGRFREVGGQVVGRVFFEEEALEELLLGLLESFDLGLGGFYLLEMYSSCFFS
eukprot:CAMPEP_0183744414 /NCGR_PEP_ID=MMETSP0737-20130205/65717_1 /TAXON_ID=385413 /ORGANISM="Thalassiosira miniscula, Strain CCMP1093" /LENGTH=174 /DNA_ID=CAMNT_0025980055 /DNA_START=253 /DNA_END=777 /DNA_ORIENTATION=-